MFKTARTLVKFQRGNSPTNNGASGDGGHFNNDAELDIQGSRLQVYGRDGANPKVLYDEPMYLGDPQYNNANECMWRTFRVQDSRLGLAERYKSIISPDLFRIYQPDTEGQPGAMLYWGLNRVIAETYCNGSDVRTARLILLR